MRQKFYPLFPASTTVNALSLIIPSVINEKDIISGEDIFGIHINNKYNNEYPSYIINHVFNYKAIRYVQGSTIIHLHYSDIKNVKIEIHELEEQNIISLLMRQLERKIQIKKDLLSAHQKQKEYLLRNMFI